MARHTPKHAAPKHYRGRKPAREVKRASAPERDEDLAFDIPETLDFSDPEPELPPRRTRTYEDEPRTKRRRSPVVPIVILLLLTAAGLIGYMLWTLGLFGGGDPALAGMLSTPTPVPTATPEPTQEPTPTPEPTATPEPTPPEIYDDGTEGYMSSDVLIYNDKAFELFYGSEDMAVTYADIISYFAECLPGTKVYSMLVPNHSEFGVPERVREHYDAVSQRENTSTVYDSLVNNVVAVDIYDVLNLHNNENIYLNTDSNWSSLGAYYAYTKFCETAGCEAAPLDSFKKTSYPFTGDLADATGEDCLYDNPDTLDVYDPDFDYTCEMSDDGLSFYEADAINAHDESEGYGMYLSGDRGCVRVTNSASQTGRRLLIVKDSSGSALAPFMTASFDEVHVVDPHYFYDYLPGYCEEQGITDVLFLNSTLSAGSERQHDSLWSLFG